jgi:hypothetical protein
MWSKDYQENTFQSFTYPSFKDSRELTIEYIKNGLDKIIKTNGSEKISIDFFVNKDGKLSDFEIRINYRREDKRIQEIENFLRTLDGWTPAKVKGQPVKSKVGIFA